MGKPFTDQLLDRVPMLARKPDRYIYGDFKNHFVIFATRGHSSFILSYEELLKSTFYFARILDPEHKIEVYKKMALTRNPLWTLFVIRRTSSSHLPVIPHSSAGGEAQWTWASTSGPTSCTNSIWQ